MKNSDIINRLQEMKMQGGHLHCMGCGYEWNCSIHGCRIINAAIEQLEAYEKLCASMLEESK